MATLGWHPIGDPTQRLKDAVGECAALFGTDAAFADALAKLNSGAAELDTLTASPGRRAAAQATAQ
jgi:hypothetical protein